jgi:hypothetical protein
VLDGSTSSASGSSCVCGAVCAAGDVDNAPRRVPLLVMLLLVVFFPLTKLADPGQETGRCISDVGTGERGHKVLADV